MPCCERSSRTARSPEIGGRRHLLLLGGGYAGVSLLTAERLTRPTNHPLAIRPSPVEQGRPAMVGPDQRWRDAPGLVPADARPAAADCPGSRHVEFLARDGRPGP